MSLILQLELLLPIAIRAAEQACAEILDVYNSRDFQAELKGDNSPLTLADKRAHNCIADILASTGLPLLSEEGRQIPYDERKDWEYFWMVDPLDGTKEFVKRNGEFTVNIALIHKNTPVLGVVAVPVTGEVFYGSEGNNAFKKHKGVVSELMSRQNVDLKRPGIRVVASRSHMNEETEAFINNLTDPILVSAGSSLKFMLLAEGKADVYPRFAPTMEWDTAAAQGVLNSLGIHIYQNNSNDPLVYNKSDLLNPSFISR